jgi:hypothetical protein
MSDSWQISILGPPDDAYASGPDGRAARGLMRPRDETELVRNTVDSAKIRDYLAGFLKAMHDVVSEVPESLGSFHLSEITLSAEVSASGRFSLIGAGAEVGGKGGIEFKLVRLPAQETRDHPKYPASDATDMS